MTLQNIPDLMASLTQLNEHAVQQIRKTTETPPRLSVIDLVAAVTGFTPHAAANAVLRLKAAYPEVSSLDGHFRFGGRGQRDTPVTDARGAIELLMLLPGKTAAIARQSAANVVVRYLGGDVSLVHEVMAHRQVQAQLDPEHPASIFGQTVATPCETPRAEVETILRPTEEVVIPMSERVTIMELKESMCRWPLGDPATPEFRYCGSKSPIGDTYCGHHTACRGIARHGVCPESGCSQIGGAGISKNSTAGISPQKSPVGCQVSGRRPGVPRTCRRGRFGPLQHVPGARNRSFSDGCAVAVR